MYRDDDAIRQHILLTLIVLGICVFCSVAYLKYTTQQAELYRLSIVVEKDDSKMYDYLASTSAGNSLAHGTVTASTFVTFSELGQQQYLRVRKVQQEYTEHKHKHEDKDGNVTYTYTYSWDLDNHWDANTPTVEFMAHEYSTLDMGLPLYLVNLTQIGVDNHNNYIYQHPWRTGSPSVGDHRWYYEATPNGIDGSVLVKLYGNSAYFLSSFYGYQTPEQVVSDKVAAMHTGPTVSIVISIVVIVVANLSMAYIRAKGYI